MSNRLPTPTWVKKSPWLDPHVGNLFRDEFRLVQDLKIDPWLEQAGADFKPIEIYRWIDRHHGEALFFKGLASFAPMFPVIGYHDQVASWISPPPSGFGNAIFMVMGHDNTGMLRLVGGNYFTEPSRQIGEPLTNTDFFAQYDMANDRRKQSLVLETVSKSISPEDKSLLHDISQECEHFHTMAIYITVLTSEGCLFHAAKTVVEGVKPADFSYECFGEVK